MKKLAYILICVCLTVALAVTVFAAETANMTLNAAKETVMPGETVAFTVTLSALEDCRSAGVKLSYDQDVFAFVEGSCSLETVLIASFKEGTGVFAFKEPAAVAGEIFTFRLQVKDDAAPGSYSITAKGSVRDAEGAVDTTVNGVSLSVAKETAAETTAQTEPPQQTQPASEETAPDQRAPMEGTETVPQEAKPQKGMQSADTTTPVYTIGAGSTDACEPFPWWIVAVVAVIVAGGVALVLGCRKK